MQPPKKKTNSIETLRNAFSHFTILLTLSFGLITTLTLIEEPSRTLQPTFATTTVRGPASVTKRTVVNSKPFMSTLTIGCESLEELKTVSEHIRLKSKSCGVDLTENNTVVRNVTNDFSATVFHQGNNGFTTDYVALLEGENKIVIQSKLKDGEVKTREILVLKE